MLSKALSTANALISGSTADIIIDSATTQSIAISQDFASKILDVTVRSSSQTYFVFFLLIISEQKLPSPAVIPMPQRFLF
jgi:hypothetical protein